MCIQKSDLHIASMQGCVSYESNVQLKTDLSQGGMFCLKLIVLNQFFYLFKHIYKFQIS